MSGGPSILRRPISEKSNTELTNALRANFVALQQAATLETNGSTLLSKGVASQKRPAQVPYTAWTARDENEDSLFVPAIDFSTSGLTEERSQYDITVKLFFLPNIPASRRSQHTQEAVDLVLRELHMPSVDLLIVSFPGVTFDAEDEEESSDDLVDGHKDEAEDFDAMIETWRPLEELHSRGIVSQIGLAEFGSERLQKFLPRTKVRPSVDQINVRDCCVVPKPLIIYAKREKIELLTHNDCTNILPKGTLRELLGSNENGAGVLASPNEGSEGLRGEVEPQWVVKYTAVVRDRGVIENKGYFAVAEVG
ncbi:MAG: hypothetical protein LQ347_006078 [Umbilicaria vellea]|nr:MAG: hypothetical protein LQ347_006078 [Umbilicaria vellea]